MAFVFHVIAIEYAALHAACSRADPAALTARVHPTPVATDRSISKRSWEEQIELWRCAVKSWKSAL